MLFFSGTTTSVINQRLRICIFRRRIIVNTSKREISIRDVADALLSDERSSQDGSLLFISKELLNFL